MYFSSKKMSPYTDKPKHRFLEPIDAARHYFNFFPSEITWLYSSKSYQASWMAELPAWLQLASVAVLEVDVCRYVHTWLQQLITSRIVAKLGVYLPIRPHISLSAYIIAALLNKLTYSSELSSWIYAVLRTIRSYLLVGQPTVYGFPQMRDDSLRNSRGGVLV